MTQKDIVKQWLEIANTDLEAGKDLFNTKKYLLCIFFCHQTLEKHLKAYILKTFNRTPPPIHDLVRLSKEAELLNGFSKFNKLLEELAPFYIKSRYPNYKQKVFNKASKAYTSQILDKTNECVAWLLKKMN